MKSNKSKERIWKAQTKPKKKNLSTEQNKFQNRIEKLHPQTHGTSELDYFITIPSGD